MTSAYAAIAAGAFPVKPWGVAGLSAKPADGGQPPADAGLWQLDEADEMRHLLSAVVEGGSGHRARLPIRTYGKTGTSQEHRDAWFIGFAGNLVVGVWVGNDDDSPMKGVTGGSLPAQIWKSFMREAMDTDPDFERKLPQIAAFQAREREPQGWATRLVESESLATVVAPDPTEISRFRHVTASGLLDRERERQLETRRRSSRTISHDFQKQLNALGWP
jgi:penicillin-binding protein 1A